MVGLIFGAIAFVFLISLQARLPLGGDVSLTVSDLESSTNYYFRDIEEHDRAAAADKALN